MLLYDSKCKHTALKKKICFNKSKKKLKINITGIVICIKLIWITCPKILQLFQQAVQPENQYWVNMNRNYTCNIFTTLSKVCNDLPRVTVSKKL